MLNEGRIIWVVGIIIGREWRGDRRENDIEHSLERWDELFEA